MGKRIKGVALIVKNPVGQILVLKEFKSKPHIGKLAGMFSIPMETAVAGESDNSTLHRLIETELTGLREKIKVCPMRIPYSIGSNASASLFVGSTSDSSLPAAFDSEEVGEHIWIMPSEALRLWLREGVKEMIVDYISGVIMATPGNAHIF